MPDEALPRQHAILLLRTGYPESPLNLPQNQPNPEANPGQNANDKDTNQPLQKPSYDRSCDHISKNLLMFGRR